MTTVHRKLSLALALAICIASASLVAAQPALAGSKESDAQSQVKQETSVVENDPTSYAQKIIQMMLKFLNERQQAANGILRR